MLKKTLAIVLVAMVLLGMVACGEEEKDVTITRAVDALKASWSEYYRDSAVENDGYLQIANTRRIVFKENTVKDMKNIAYVVEFLLYTDYYGSAPYYVQTTGIMDTVIVYKDGTLEVGSNPLKAYSSQYYSWDFSAFVESVENLGNQYNITEKLK